MAKSILEQLVELLRDVQMDVPQIEASQLVNVDGFLLATSLPANDGETLPLLFAEMFLTSQTLIAQYPLGLSEYVCVQGKNGVVLFLPVNEKCFLSVLARRDVDDVVNHVKSFIPRLAALI